MAPARELDVEWLYPDGRAGGREAAGRVVTVRGALPGDRVLLDEADGARDAAIARILAPSPDRRQPPCPFDARCGGCDLSALEPEARRRHLGRAAARALGLDREPAWVPSPRASAHCARIQLSIDDGRIGYRPPGAPGAGSRLVEVDRCLAAREEVQEALARLVRWSSGGRARGLDRVELRSDGARVVHAFEGTPSSPLDLGDVALDGRAVTGDPTLAIPVLGRRLRASPTAFYQVNLEVNHELARWVGAEVARLEPERVLDLYAGIGNLTVPLAALGVPVVAVEAHPAAVDDLRHNTRGLDVKVIGARVERFDAAREPFDVVVLDPPRAGVEGGSLQRWVRNRPRAIVYVACNVLTAARDIRAVTRAGYAVDTVRLFDMFPDTHHFETVVVLARAR